jgi:hypothetical protein
MGEQRQNQLPERLPLNWRQSLHEFSLPADPPTGELTRLENSFIAGIKQARRDSRPQHQLPARFWRWGLGLALLCLLMASIPLLFPHETALIAANYPGMQGQVISGNDRLPVSNVQVCLQCEQQDGGGQSVNREELVDVTDACGFFDIPARELEQPCEVRFIRDGEELAKLDCVPGVTDFIGFERIVIRDSKTKACEKFDVVLQPGKTKEVSPGISVSLAASAAGPWQGALIYDRRWPSAFSYGCVVDGIFQLDGSPVDGLTLSVVLDKADLEFFNASAKQVKLISFCEEYLRRDRFQGFHRGWYAADQPPKGYGLAAMAGRLQQTDEQAAVLSWPAQPGEKYALKVPLRVTGEYVLTHYNPDGAHYDSPRYLRLQLTNQNHPQLYLVRNFRAQSLSGEYSEITMQPRVAQPFQELTKVENLPDAPAAVAEPPELLDYYPAGAWRMEIVDFTLDEPYRFTYSPPDSISKPSSYQLQCAPGVVGGKSIARITGDLDRLASPPAWDLFGDYVDDAYGTEVEIPAPYPGSYKVRVTLRDDNGAVTVIEDQIQVIDPRLSLFMMGYMANPVLPCAGEAPAQEQSQLVLTNNALANPLPYGYTSSGIAGPGWICDLPASLHDVPLKKLRLVMYASAAGAENRHVGLQPVLFQIPHEQPGPMLKGEKEWVFASGNTWDINNNGLSHAARYGLRAYKDGEDLHQFFAIGSQFYETWLDGISESIEHKFGWDFDNLPPSEVIAATLQEFMDSPALGRRYVIDQDQRLEWEFNLYDQQLPAGEDLLVWVNLETQGLLVSGQWLLYSGGDKAGYIEVEVEGQEPWRGYLDLSPLATNNKKAGD